MKKLILPGILCLIFSCLAITGCNKPFTPPTVAGTWKLNAKQIQWGFTANTDALYQHPEISAKYPELQSIFDAATAFMTEALADISPQFVVLSPDGTFQFHYADTRLANGTYVQDGYYIYLTFLAGEEYTELMAVSDGSVLELYFGISQLTPLFAQALNLTSTETESFFGDNYPIIKDMTATIPFSIETSFPIFHLNK